jgi:hypothetical protein
MSGTVRATNPENYLGHGSQGLVTFFRVLFFMELTFNVLTMLHFWTHRKAPIVANRGLWSCLLFAAGITIASLCESGSLAFDLPCWISPLVNFVSQTFAIVFIVERYVLVYVSFAVTQEVKSFVGMRFKNGGTEITGVTSNHSKGLRKWMYDHRKYFRHGLLTPSKLAGLVAAVLASPIFIVIGFLGYPDAMYKPTSSKECFEATYYQWLIQVLGMGVPGVATIFYAWKELRKVEENFMIIRDLKLMAVLGGMMLATFVCNLLPPVYAFGIAPLTLPFSILASASVWVICASFWFHNPFLGKHSDQSINTSSAMVSSSNDLTLKPIEQLKKILLDNGEEFAHFESFLCREFSVENAYFWKTVEHLKRVNDLGKFKTEAEKLYKHFICNDGEFSLNLSDENQSKAVRFFEDHKDALADDEYKEQCLSALSHAEEEIFELMLTDSFRRFKRYNAHLAATVTKKAAAVDVVTVAHLELRENISNTF